MAAAHKCESCFESTTAERWVCDECFAEGRAAQIECARQGGNMAEQQQAFQVGCAMRAARVRDARGATLAQSPASRASGPFDPVPAARPR